MEKIRVGISQCLLGENVRYDGQHKQDPYITGVLGQWFEFVPVCPEVECGMGVPRKRIQLEGRVEAPRMVTIETRNDLTTLMQAWCSRRMPELEGEALCGFIFKRKSPSCGVERVKVYSAENEAPENKGTGLFAAAFMHHFPELPVAEEDWLHDPGLRENFIERVLALKRWRELIADGSGASGLVKFHAHYKYLLMAHSVPLYRELGRITADLKNRPIEQIQADYYERLMKALALRTTVKKQVNVLQHMAGYFKKQLNADEKRELHEVVERYHEGHVPLIVPIAILNHYVEKYDERYLKNQYYLNPHPMELHLRNHLD